MNELTIKHLKLNQLDDKLDQALLYALFAQQLALYLRNKTKFSIKKFKKNLAQKTIDLQRLHEVKLATQRYGLFLDQSIKIIPYDEESYLFVPVAETIGAGAFGKVKALSHQQCFLGSFNGTGRNKSFNCLPIKLSRDELGICKTIKYVRENYVNERTDEQTAYQDWQAVIKQEVRNTNLANPHTIDKFIFSASKAYLFGTRHRGQDLFNTLDLNKNNALNRLAMMQSALAALAALHQPKIVDDDDDDEIKLVHGDIKPENMIFDSNTGTMKFIDFGSSNQDQTDGKLNITAYYVAPELISSARSKGVDQPVLKTQAQDVFSMGICLIEILGIDTKTVFDKTVKADAEGYMIPVLTYIEGAARTPDLLQVFDAGYDQVVGNCPAAKPAIRRIIAAMLAAPDERPTAVEVLNTMKAINERIAVAKQLDYIINTLEAKNLPNPENKVNAFKQLQADLFNKNDSILTILQQWESQSTAQSDKTNLQIIKTRRGWHGHFTHGFWNKFSYPASLQAYLMLKQTLIETATVGNRHRRKSCC